MINLCAALPLLTMTATEPPQIPGLGDLREDPALSAKVRQSVEGAVEKFKDKGAKLELLAATFVELSRNAKEQRFGQFRGSEGYYPASVVKLFWLAFSERQLEDKKIKLTPEFQRSLEDMIRESSNDATHNVVDVCTGTTGGPELTGNALKTWENKRNVANRWFAGMGYEGINVNQKTWCEGPYGRERIFYGEKYTNRNKLTALATARLMTDIALDRSVTPARCAEMKNLLKREIPSESDKADAQSTGYTGKILPKGSQLWSKAGWTDTARHDVAYVKLPNGKEFVVSVYTFQLANVGDIIPTIAETLLKPYDEEAFARTGK